MKYIGIDLGTSAVKLLLMDGSGAVEKIVSREYPIYFPRPGWSQQDPKDWYEKTMEGLKELLEVCDRIVIMRNGRIRGERAASELDIESIYSMCMQGEES